MEELKRLKRDIVYNGKVFDVIVDYVEYPSGNGGIREVVHHPGGAVIVPLLEDGRVMLVKQLRYPFGKHILELPAGKLSPNEDPEKAAARELEEETGWMAGTLTRVTSIYTTPGFCDEVLTIFLATNLTQSSGGHHREEGEYSMTVHSMEFEDALHLIETGELSDGKTIVGLLLAERHLRNGSAS